ncbi:hypothetical protein [Ureibacillus acetophenoni]
MKAYEEALLRETYEEGYVKGTVQYIGSIEVNHEENLSFDVNGMYPIQSKKVQFSTGWKNSYG